MTEKFVFIALIDLFKKSYNLYGLQVDNLMNHLKDWISKLYNCIRHKLNNH